MAPVRRSTGESNKPPARLRASALGLGSGPRVEPLKPPAAIRSPGLMGRRGSVKRGDNPRSGARSAGADPFTSQDRDRTGNSEENSKHRTESEQTKPPESAIGSGAEIKNRKRESRGLVKDGGHVDKNDARARLEEQLTSTELDNIRQTIQAELYKRRMSPTAFATTYGATSPEVLKAFLAMKPRVLRSKHIEALKKDVVTVQDLPLPDFKRSERLRDVLLELMAKKALAIEEVRAISGISQPLVASYLKENGGLYLGAKTLDRFEVSIPRLNQLKDPDPTAQTKLREQVRQYLARLVLMNDVPRKFWNPYFTLARQSQVPLTSIEEFMAGEAISSNYAEKLAEAMIGGGGVDDGDVSP